MEGDSTEFRALGPFEVLRGGRALDLGSPKQRAVLGLLLSAAPHALPVSRLVDEVWGPSPPADPVRSLQVYVSGLRKALGPEPALVGAAQSYRLDLSAECYDVPRFLQAAERCIGLARAGSHADVVAEAQAALMAWRGEAWQDLRAVPTLDAEATSLEERRLDLVALRIGSQLALGRHRDVVPELTRLHAAHPLREDLCAHLVLALHRSGRQSDALRVYADARAVKVEETGLEPGAALRELHAAVLADDPALRNDDEMVRGRRHLPAVQTGLIGRQDEVDALTDRLRTDCRLLSVCGPGGVGKTRLALEVAHLLAADYPDGVWFVGLAELTDPRLVPQAVAEALGVEEVAGDFVAPLHEHLADRKVLLLLDNVEQVTEAAPLLSSLLGRAAGLTLMVTSRLPLRLYGEHVWRLEALAPVDAVHLFRERARRADHRFDASREADARRLCEALDGLPLAIELVAARAGELTLPQMLEQLGRRVELAGEGPVDRTPRQQSLRGAVRWSVDLLEPEDAQAVRRLAVFAGGWTAAAATAVGVTSDQLERLVAASLVLDREERFLMLETVRDVLTELLEETGETGAARELHACHFADLAAEGARGMRADPAGWTKALAAERSNLRAALDHLEQTADQDQPRGLRLIGMAGDLTMFWYRTSPASEDVNWLERALGASPDAPPVLRGRALHGLAVCRGEQGRPEDAIAASRASNELFREAGDLPQLARALNTLGGLTRDLGRFDEAVPLLQEGAELRRRLDDPFLPLSIALDNLAMVALDVGDLATARACLEENLARADPDDEEQLPLAQTLLADAALAEGDTATAEALLREAVPELRRLELHFRLIETLDTFAALAVAVGKPSVAATLVAAADRAAADAQQVLVPADAMMRRRRVGAALDELPGPERSAAEALGRTLDLDAAVTWASHRLLGS